MLTTYQSKLDTINQMVHDVAQKVLQAHKIALKAFKKKDIEAFDRVRELIKSLDIEARQIDNEIVKTIALYGPEATHLRELIASIKLTNEVVRIGDYAKTYAKNIAKHIQNKVSFSQIDEYIVQLHKNAIEAIEVAFRMLDSEDIEELYRKVLVEESKTDEIFKLFEKELIAHLCNDVSMLQDYLNVLSTCRKLERAADRAVEVAKLLIFAKKGGMLENF